MTNVLVICNTLRQADELMGRMYRMLTRFGNMPVSMVKSRRVLSIRNVVEFEMAFTSSRQYRTHDYHEFGERTVSGDDLDALLDRIILDSVAAGLYYAKH